MRSVKPGRGPSGMSFMFSVVFIVFGLIWTITSIRITSEAPFGMGMIFPLLGVIFIVIGIVQAIFHFKNATGKHRFSLFDITDSHEEGDPSTSWIKDETQDEDGRTETVNDDANKTETGFDYCPYCGFDLKDDYEFCPKCGKDI